MGTQKAVDLEANGPAMEHIITTAAMTPSRGCRMEARAGGVLAEAETLMGLQCQGELG